MGKHHKQIKEPTDNTIIASMLIEQIKYLYSEKNSIQTSFLTIISFSLGAYGLAIYYAFSFDAQYPNEVNYTFIILPFLFSLSFYNIIKYTIRMLRLSEYIRHLEKSINTLHKGKPIFQWESKLISANGWGIVGGVAQIPCYIAIVALLGVKFVENIYKLKVLPLLRTTLIISIVLFIFILFILLIMSVLERNSISKKIDQLSLDEPDKETIDKA